MILKNSAKFYFLLICLFVLISVSHISGQTTAKNYRFTNSNWFDGKSFKKREFYSIGGIFSRRKPAKIDETVDLQNGFVVPPFADAHTHHFDSTYAIASQVKMYLEKGIFYAKVQTNVRSEAVKVADKVNKRDSIDVSYAHGALTHTNGHGIEIYEALALNLYFDRKLYDANIEKIAKSRIRDNDAYYIIDTAQDLENKWQKVLDGKPDFLKIYLMESEDFARKSKDFSSFPFGSIGIDPKLVPAIVQKAHAAGLRVSAHVDTVTDYRIALNAGVDEMAHLPGYYVKKREDLVKHLLTEADIKETAKRKVWIVPAPVFYGGISPEIRKITDEGLKHNLGLMKKFGVKVAFGSDSYGRTSLEDVLYLNQIGIYNNLEALKMWAADSPQTIFPKRKIGKLQENYEASFIVLKGNPLENFPEVKNISFRFKQGEFIQIK